MDQLEEKLQPETMKYEIVAVVTIDPDTEDLILVKSTSKDYWRFPGGYILSQDGDPKEAAIRIVRQLMGINIDPTYIERIKRNTSYLNVFAARVNSKEIRPSSMTRISKLPANNVAEIAKIPNMQKMLFYDAIKKIRTLP